VGNTDLSTPISPDHALGRPLAHPGNGVQPIPRLRERGEHPIDLRVELGEHLGVALASDQGRQHRPTRGAQHL
jgi:hypothetical protein